MSTRVPKGTHELEPDASGDWGQLVVQAKEAIEAEEREWNERIRQVQEGLAQARRAAEAEARQAALAQAKEDEEWRALRERAHLAQALAEEREWNQRIGRVRASAPPAPFDALGVVVPARAQRAPRVDPPRIHVWP